MKIVYIYPAIATKGGVERILVDKMNLLADETGYEVYLLTYNQGQHAVSFPLNDRVHHIDLKVCTYAQYHYRGLRRLWEGWKRERWLCQRMRQALKEIAPDVLVTTTSECLSLLFRLKGKTPLVVESHGGFDHLIDYPAMTWRHRWDIRHRYRLLRKAEAIVTLTARDAEKWQKNYPQVRVIPNVVHLNPTGCLTDVTQKRVIFVARLAEQKGIPELMAVWRIAHQRHPDWLLDMYGEGDNASMSQMAEGMRSFPPIADIFSKYLESSILILTSRWEPFGLVIPEAMSCGLSVVSFDNDGPCSIITDGEDGFIIRNRDIGTFANRLCQLMEDQELRKRMGQKAKVSAQRYSAQNIMPMWKKLFISLNSTI